MSAIKDLIRGIPFGAWLLVLFRPIGIIWDALIDALPYIDSRIDFIVVVGVISFVLDFSSFLTFSQQIALIEPFGVLVWNLLVLVWDVVLIAVDAVTSIPIVGEWVDGVLNWFVERLGDKYVPW